MPTLQPITIHLQRHKEGRTIFTVTRADGSSTWMKLYPNMEMHDLVHYAIETELQLTDAFYGLIAQGYDIGAFEAPPEQRPEALIPANLPRVSLQVEHLVNLLLTELQSGEVWPDFIPQFQQILRQSDLPEMPELTPDKLSAIREQLLLLRGRWNAVEVGGAMELEFGS